MRAYRPAWAPTSIDPESYTERLLGLTASALSVETDCPDCGGTGELEYVREKRLDELSGLQQKFLLAADMERENPDEEQQQQIDQAKAKANMAGHGGGRAPTGVGRPSPGGAPSPRR